MTLKQIQRLLLKQEEDGRHALALALQTMEGHDLCYEHHVLWAWTEQVWRVFWPIELGRALPFGKEDTRILTFPLEGPTTPYNVVELLTNGNVNDQSPRVYLSVLLNNHVLITLDEADPVTRAAEARRLTAVYENAWQIPKI